MPQLGIRFHGLAEVPAGLVVDGYADVFRDPATGADRLQLRPLDPVLEGLGTLTYEPLPRGRYFAGVVVLPEVRATAVAEVFGFEVEGDLGDGTDGRAVGFQVSLDGGTSWLYWDGVAWATAVAWSPAEDLAEHLWALPLVDRLRLRVQLTPSADGKATPAVDALWVLLEYRVAYYVDVLSTVVAGLLGSPVELVDVQALAAAATATIRANLPPDDASVVAYNLTTDPGRQVNVAASVVGGVVTFTAAQTGTVRLEFQAPLRVVVARDPLCPEATPDPRPGVVVILDTGGAREPPGGVCSGEEEDAEPAVAVARVRPTPRYGATPVDLYLQGPDPATTQLLEEAVVAALWESRVLVSPLTGQGYAVCRYAQVGDRSRISDGLHVTQVRATLLGARWLGPVSSIPLVEEVRVSLGAFSEASEVLVLP